MPPVPIYSQSPISAAKPDGVTPQTDAAQAGDSKQQQQSTPTKTAPSPRAYPPAQPGASLPGPTAVPNTRYAPAQQPTPTTTLPISHGPPPPQPGAVPVPPGNSPPGKTALPPPPKAGEKYSPPAPAPVTTAAPHYPPQMGIPPPTIPITAQRGATATATGAPSAHAPVPLPQHFGGPSQAGPDLNHPPGYQQDANAGELSSAQRAAQYSPAAGYGQGGGQGGYGGGEEGEGYWDAVTKFAKSAGEKLSAAEEEVWKRINKQ